MKKVLIINKDQFGYFTDTLEYCNYASDRYNVSVICLDWGMKKIVLDGIDIKYIKKPNKNIFIFSVLLVEAIKEIRKEKYDKVICTYFRGCFLLNIFESRSKIVLDIRTGNVSKNLYRRLISDFEMRIHVIFFRNISIISESLANKLYIKKYKLLPLGGKKIISQRENKDEMNLLYIGTFNNRRIEDTIIGYKEFLDRNQKKIKSKYTIIGFGSIEDERKILDLIQELGLQEQVFFEGRKTREEIIPFLEEHNIGIAYVPITPYYNVQPPTKTFEYILNGLICIATNTEENAKVITKQNGILCGDNPKSFCEALEKIALNLDKFNYIDVEKSLKEFNWKSICENYLYPIIDS